MSVGKGYVPDKKAYVNLAPALREQVSNYLKMQSADDIRKNVYSLVRAGQLSTVLIYLLAEVRRQDEEKPTK